MGIPVSWVEGGAPRSLGARIVVPAGMAAHGAAITVARATISFVDGTYDDAVERAAGKEGPDLVIVLIGVGTLAAAIIGHYRRPDAPDRRIRCATVAPPRSPGRRWWAASRRSSRSGAKQRAAPCAADPDAYAWIVG